MTADAPRVGRVAGEALLVLVAVLAYLWLFRLYGFDLVDEGTQLAQIDRAARGARPYLDFETGYTPGYFALHVGLWQASGADLIATRTFGVVLHATTAAFLYAVARCWLGALVAVCLVAIDVAFLLPVSARSGAPFNTPYPGWIAAPLALAAQVVIAGLVQARTPPARASAGRAATSLLACGAAAGLAFSVKPNAGLFALGGAALALCAGFRTTRPGAVTLSRLLRGGALLAAVALLGGASLSPAYALLLLLPVLVAVARSAPRAAAAGDDERTVVPWRDAAFLAAGFLLVVLPWLKPLAHEIGVAGIARDVLFLDARGVVAAYLLPLGLPSGAVAALLAGCAAAALVVVGAERSRAAPATRRALAGAALALGFGAAAVVGEGGPREVAEAAFVWLGPLVLVLGLAFPARGPEEPRDRALLVFAAVFSLQLFPRPDLIHVAMGAPPVLLAGGAAWRRFAAPLASRSSRVPALAATGAVLALCAARLTPALAVRIGEPLAALDAGPRAPLTVAAAHAGETRWLGEAVRGITARTAADDAVFYFPDLAGLGFLADRPSPFYYLYFVPGRPDRTGEERTLAELERATPALAVVGEPRVAAFRDATAYFSGIAAHLEESFRPVEELEGCVLLERRPGPETAAVGRGGGSG